MTAPIIVFAYKRAWHLEQTLAALSQNDLAAQSDLYIFCDGPKAEKDALQVQEARQIAKSAQGFRKLTVTERQNNLGLASSVIAGVTEVINQHGRVIVVEDDIQTSRNFLTYMNNALDAYADDPNAFSLTGFSYAEEYLPIPADYPYDTYSSFRASSWTWATWADRWAKVRWDMDYYESFARDRAGKALFNRGGADMFWLLDLQHQGRIDSWAIRFAYALHVLNMNCIYPVKSLAKNIGLDGSGVHCGEDPKAEHKDLAVDWLPKRFCPASLHDARIDRAFYEIFDQPPEPARPKLLQRLREAFKNQAST